MTEVMSSRNTSIPMKRPFDQGKLTKTYLGMKAAENGESLVKYWQENPNPGADQIKKIAETIYPPMTEQQVSMWFSTQNQAGASQAEESIKSQLSSLLKIGYLTDPQQISKFLRIMHKSVEDEDVVLVLEAIYKTRDVTILEHFIGGKGMDIIDNWCKTFGLKSERNTMVLLKTLGVIPFDRQIFSKYSIGKYLRKISKGSIQGKAATHLDCKTAALNLMDKWQKLTVEQMKSSPPAAKKAKPPPQKPTIPDKPIAKASFDIFNQLKAPSGAKMKKERISSIPPLKKVSSVDILDSISPPGSSSSATAALNYQSSSVKEVSLPSYSSKQTFSPTEGSKKKKSVKFKTEDELLDVRFFEIDDAPASINSTSSDLPVNADLNSATISQVPWKTPDCKQRSNKVILIPNFPKYPVESVEAKNQEAREKSVLSVFYVDPRDMPISPAEPDLDLSPYLEPRIWPLDGAEVLPAPIPVVNSLQPNIQGLLSSLLPTIGAGISVPLLPLNQPKISQPGASTPEGSGNVFAPSRPGFPAAGSHIIPPQKPISQSYQPYPISRPQRPPPGGLNTGAPKTGHGIPKGFVNGQYVGNRGRELLLLLYFHLKKSKLKKTTQALEEEIDELQQTQMLLPPTVDWNARVFPTRVKELQERFPHIASKCLAEIVPKVLLDSKSPEFESPRSILYLKNPLKSTSFMGSRFQKLISVFGHPCPVYSIAFDGTGKRFFTGGDDNLVKVWDTETGWLIRTIRAHKTVTRNDPGVVSGLVIDSENKFLVTGSSDKSIRIWDLKTFEPLGYIFVGKPISCILVSPSVDPKTKVLVVTTNDSKVRIYNWNGGENVFEKSAIELESGTYTRDRIITLTFDTPGSIFATGGEDGIVNLFSLPIAPTGEKPSLLRSFVTHMAPITDVAVSNLGHTLASGCKQGVLGIHKFDHARKDWTTTKISINDFAKREYLQSLLKKSNSGSDNEMHANMAENSVTGSTIGGFNTTHIPLSDLDIENVNSVNCFPNQIQMINIAWLSDDSYILTTTSDFLLRVWYADGSHFRTIHGHESSISVLQCHPYLHTVVLTCSSDGCVYLWDAVKGEKVFEYCVKEEILTGYFSPSGEEFLVSDFRGAVHIFGVGKDLTSYIDTPYEQFHFLDWKLVKEDAEGNLIDEESQMASHEMEMGPVVSHHRAPYPITEVQVAVKTADFITSNHWVENDYHRRRAALESELENIMEELKAAQSFETVDKKQLRKRRRQIMVEHEAHNFPVPDHPMSVLMDIPDVPIPLPASSGDEYSTDGGDNSDEVSEGGRGDHLPRSPVEDFVANDTEMRLSDSDESMNIGERRITRQNKRKRSNALSLDSEDELISEFHIRNNGGNSANFQRPKRATSSKIRVIEESEDEDFPEDELVVVNYQREEKAAPEVVIKLDPPLWLAVTKHYPSPYLAQLGDFVVYVKQGHMAFAAATASIAESIVDNSLPELILAKIVDLSYKPGAVVTCHATLAIYPTLQLPQDLDDTTDLPRITISYFDAENVPDFLILWEDFEKTFHQHLTVGAKVFVRCDQEEFGATLTEILEIDTPWEKYRIIYENSDVPAPISPWELKLEGSTWAKIPAMEPSEIVRVASVLQEISHDPDLEVFVNEVPYEQFPSYLSFVAYPMYITLIQERLVNGFYRRIEHLIWEWELIGKNACAFNSSNSAIYRLAKKSLLPLRRKILGLPEVEEEPITPAPLQSPLEINDAYEMVDDMTENYDDTYSPAGRSRDLRPRASTQRPKKVKRKSLRARKTRVHLDDDDYDDFDMTPDEDSGSDF